MTEQGLGDIILFIRFARVLKDKGINISICTPERLHPLIQSSGIDCSPLTPEQASLASEGQWLPLLSVPHKLRASPSNPIITEPYIRSTPN